jgi:hypothetical protein
MCQQLFTMPLKVGFEKKCDSGKPDEKHRYWYPCEVVWCCHASNVSKDDENATDFFYF